MHFFTGFSFLTSHDIRFFLKGNQRRTYGTQEGLREPGFPSHLEFPAHEHGDDFRH